MEQDTPNTQVVSQACYLKSRRHVPGHDRKRGQGGGRPFKAAIVRQQLYEWWAGLRYAIDWQTLIENRRSRGKQHLACCPASAIYSNGRQLLGEFVYASLLNGVVVESCVLDTWWLKRWLEENVLPLKHTNITYQVPRAVVKERLEIL